MIYVTSDIHGNLDRYKKLKEALITEEDTLYIIGDVLDRGKQGFAILDDVMASPNVHLLMGNHELAHYMIHESNKRYKVTQKDRYRKEKENWEEYIINPLAGGHQTQNELSQMQPADIAKYMRYIGNLPFYKHLEVNNKHFVLSHGTISADLIEAATNRINMNLLFMIKFQGEKIRDVRAIDMARTRHIDAEDIKDIINKYEEKGYLTDATCIVGHTPTCFIYPTPEKKMSVLRAGNNIDIDCGCKGNYPNNKNSAGYYGRLACIRLEDEAIFYFE